MVRIKYALLSLAVVVFTDCMSVELSAPELEEAGAQQRTLTASLVVDGATKTLIDPKPEGDGYKVFWAPNDQVYVFLDGDNKQKIFRLTSGEGTAVAKFVGYGEGSEIQAVSPYLTNDETYAEMLSSRTIRVRVPYLQTYHPHTADPKMILMAAKGVDWNLSFKHLMSYLKIPLKGNHVLTSIELHSNGGRDVEQYWYHRDAPQYYNRQLDILWDEEGNPRLDVTHEQPSKMFPTMIDCSGLALDQEEETEIILAVIPQTFYGGFTVTVNTIGGSMTKTVTSDFTFEKGKVHTTGVLEVSLAGELEPSSTLQGEGTAETPFLIKDLQDLLYFSARVNYPGGTICPEGGGSPVIAATAHYKQTADISLAPVCGHGVGNWNPIANANLDESICFWGTYDGSGHKITDLFIDYVDDSNSAGNFALFGQVGGTISNLEVNGICGTFQGNAAILCANLTKRGKFVNCITRGIGASVWGHVAGVTYAAQSVEDCTNYANLMTHPEGWAQATAGIVCEASYVFNCRNEGEVVSNSRSDSSSASGIVTSADVVLNCMNSGSVASYYGGAAGITYGVFVFDPGSPTRIVNCINVADVTSQASRKDGKAVVSGIIGQGKGGTVSNCLNAGSACSKGSWCGSILGYGNYPVNLYNCYGLYDITNQVGTQWLVGSNTGSATSCYILDLNQVWGVSAYASPLYINHNGGEYGFVLDALNAWAAENSTKEETYFQWFRTEEGSIPELATSPAVMPNVTEIFLARERSVSLTSGAMRFQTQITSSRGFQIASIPTWIHEISTEENAVSNAWTRYLSRFEVDANPTEIEREGEIVFSDGNGNSEVVTVSQSGIRPIIENWMAQSFAKKSLLAITCATWCGNCPRLLRASEEVQGTRPGTLEVAVLHSPTSALAFSGTASIMSQYGSTAIPTGFFNFSERATSSSDLYSLVAEQQLIPAKTGIDVHSVIDNGVAHIETRVFVKSGGNYKVSVWLLEDGVIGYQSDYVNGASDSFAHNDTVFASVTTLLGEPFVATSGEVVSREYNAAISSHRKLDNIRVLVFVWAQDSESVYSIDNCASVPLGVDLPLLFQ